MAIVTTDDKHYKAIADKIRELSTMWEDHHTFLPSDMASGIGSVYKSGIERGKTEGKIELLQDSKHMNAKLSGNVIAANDVSPTEHDVAVALSSESVTDFSGVNVKRYGKNLCPKATVSQTMNGVTFTPQADGTIITNGTATADTQYIIAVDMQYLPIDTNITLSGCPAGGDSTRYGLCLSWVGMYDYGRGINYRIGSATAATNWRKSLGIVVKAGVVMDGLVFAPQIQIGQKTEYEPYVEPIAYAPNVDGTLTMPSLSPSMTLVTDTDGVTLDCSYLRDIDVYIDNLIMNVALTGGE